MIMQNKTLILNPTENIYPFISKTHSLKGLYIPQERRNKFSRVIFAGRDKYSDSIQQIYKKWNYRLNSGKITLALLSGLHASIILFMSLQNINNKVMILPVDGGGHFATRQILERLGYDVYDFKIDYKKYQIDIDATLSYANTINPDYIFVARSNSMQYDDFSWLNEIKSNPLKIFDASQYLAGILTQRFNSPFDMGFDIILSSLHKDFPGTQQALCAFSHKAIEMDLDKSILNNCSKYISSIHPMEIFNSAYYLEHFSKLESYETNKIDNCKKLYDELCGCHIPVHDKCFDGTETQQIWVKCDTQHQAYTLFKKLEDIGIFTNYMKLPYRLGYGLRLGTGAATIQGLKPCHCVDVADFIEACNNNQCLNEFDSIRNKCQDFLNSFIIEQQDSI